MTSLRSVKLHGKKKIEIVCSFSGIPITWRLEMDVFFTQIKNNVYITLSGLKRPFHVTRDMSSEREFRCSLYVTVSLRI